MKKILDLLEYNFWANDQFIIRLAEQEEIPEQITKLMSHILSAHRIWLCRIKNEAGPTKVWGDVEQSLWEEMNIKLYHDSGDIIKSGDLNKAVHYRNSKGELFVNTVEDIFYHLINHSTHHRAQVAVLMRQNQILPPASDYIFYLRK